VGGRASFDTLTLLRMAAATLYRCFGEPFPRNLMIDKRFNLSTSTQTSNLKSEIRSLPSLFARFSVICTEAPLDTQGVLQVEHTSIRQ
jgi:hypothetical protein